MKINKLEKPRKIYLIQGIADGVSVMDMAAELEIDRSTLGGWLKRTSFLEALVEAVSAPEDLDQTSLCNLLGSRYRGETEADYHRRKTIADWLKVRFPKSKSIRAAERHNRAA